MKEIIHYQYISVDKLDLKPWSDCNVEVYMLRLDHIHPLYGGNKILKLIPFLNRFDSGEYHSIATMGGAFSNHLVAAVAVCHERSIPLKVYIRAFKADEKNPVIQWLRKLKTEIFYVHPTVYRTMRDSSLSPLDDSKVLWIPEGGFRPDAFSIPAFNILPVQNFDLAVAAGTGTTAVGLAHHYKQSKVHVFPALKNWKLPDKFNSLPDNINVVTGYDFGGFAKWNQSLIDFMHALYKHCNLATDVIYTSKMLFGICDILRNNPGYFTRPLLIVHTGGLTGNIGFDYRFPGVLSEKLVNRELLC